MSTEDIQSNDKVNSSRRRRWEVKSKECFEESLAIEMESTDKNIKKKNIRKVKSNTGRDACSLQNNSLDNRNSKTSNNKNMSTKLSTLLNNAARFSERENENCERLSNYDESLIKSELRNQFEMNTNLVEPSAPPVSPSPSDKTDEILNKNSLSVKPIHSGMLINSQITQQLNQLKDDIVEGKENNFSNIPSFNVSGLVINPSSSNLNGNISAIYCEKLNNFIISNSDSLINQKKNEPLRDIRQKETPKVHALFLQTGFRTFSILCQGLLAGIVMAHCLMIFLLAETAHIFLMKHNLEHVFFSLIFFLTSICLVSSLDRYDVAGQGIFSEHGLRIPWTPLLYLISFILTVIAVRAEDFITHSHLYSADVQSKKSHLLTWWKFMCLARTSFAVFAWVTIVTDPHTDALNNRVQELTED